MLDLKVLVLHLDVSWLPVSSWGALDGSTVSPSVKSSLSFLGLILIIFGCFLSLLLLLIGVLLLVLKNNIGNNETDHDNHDYNHNDYDNS